MSITILGLGPGDGRFFTQEAMAVLADANTVYLRTSSHPAVKDLPSHLELHDFDSVYEEAADFQKVYQRISDEIIDLGKGAAAAENGIIYAVPGNPLVGETTTKLILESAKLENVPVKVIAGLSFIEPTINALGLDGLDGLQIFDAVEIAGFNYPPIDNDIPALIAQVYSKLIASELKLSLSAIYPDEHQVVLVHAAGTDSQDLETVPLYMIDRSKKLSHLTSLYVLPLPDPASLNALAETIAILRGPDGCPWDQEQTSKSLRSGLLEEASEVLIAIDTEDNDSLAEELGDLLYHIVMQAQIASEENLFSLSDIITGIRSKLIRRHPHIWDDWQVVNSKEVIQNWEYLKRTEKGELNSLMDNIPSALPALARAQFIQNRVAKIGFDWDTIEGVKGKVDEELGELERASDMRMKAHELGDILSALVNLARWLGIDAEIALREANLRFEYRFREMEQIATNRDLDLEIMEIEDLEALWREAKKKVGSTT